MSWGTWAIIAVALIILELVVTDFTFLMIAGGALGGAVAGIFTDSWVVQVLVAASIAVLLLFIVRPIIRQRINNSSRGRTNVYAMEGKIAHTLTEVTDKAGRAKVGGDVWSAISMGDAIAADTDVVVRAVSGAQLVLAPIATTPPDGPQQTALQNPPVQ